MKAAVDQEDCLGCGVCVDVCPEVFEMGRDDKAEVIVEVVPLEAEDRCREAAEMCPEEAITVVDESP